MSSGSYIIKLSFNVCRTSFLLFFCTILFTIDKENEIYFVVVHIYPNEKKEKEKENNRKCDTLKDKLK